jgi:integrase
LPRRSLTAASVERIKPPDKGQVELFDKGYPGLALRVSYGGGKSWSFFYRMAGKLRRMKLGTYPALGLGEAREAWREARHAVQLGVDPSRNQKGATDFKGVAEEWLQRDQVKNRTAATVRRALDQNVLPLWGDRYIADIGRRDVLDLLDGIVDRGSPIMANRIHAHLHRLFAWSVGRDIIASNPVTGVPKPGTETRRDRVLTDKELVAIWNAAGQEGWPFGSGVRLLILTGARREEIGALRWSEIDHDLITLKGARTKSKEPHLIPLSAAAVAELRKIHRVANSDFVFTMDGGKSVKNWSRAKYRLDAIAGIEPWRVHDLRRTVATGLQKLGVSLQVVESILGHVSGSRAGVVGIYQRHNYADEKRGALRAWGQYVMALVENRPAGWAP